MKAIDEFEKDTEVMDLNRKGVICYRCRRPKHVFDASFNTDTEPCYLCKRYLASKINRYSYDVIHPDFKVLGFVEFHNRYPCGDDEYKKRRKEIEQEFLDVGIPARSLVDRIKCFFGIMGIMWRASKFLSINPYDYKYKLVHPSVLWKKK